MENEVQQAIILAAGSSKRMGDFTNNLPKCMLPYKNETIIRRLVRQLKEKGIKKIILVVGYQKEKIIEELKDIEGIHIRVVVNEIYEQDTNIHSMRLALKEVDGTCVVFEADTIMEDKLVEYVAGSDFEDVSAWFTKGKFNSQQYGGILNTDRYGKITDIKIVPEYHQDYKNYSKLTGIMRVGKKELEIFKKLVEEYANRTIKQYYLIPWIENLNLLPCIEGNAQHYLF
jgi:choline kinase